LHTRHSRRNTFNAWTLIPKAAQKILARQIGWQENPELGVYIPADTMERFAFTKANIATWLPGYDLDQTKTYTLPTQKPF
jgi:hypothetical protein